jgi:hypothetical protein
MVPGETAARGKSGADRSSPRRFGRDAKCGWTDDGRRSDARSGRGTSEADDLHETAGRSRHHRLVLDIDGRKIEKELAVGDGLCSQQNGPRELAGSPGASR